MALEYRTYLAANIMSEERVVRYSSLIITYRLLSRALKVHVNTAKQMLFEFHRQQIIMKPGTVYATYLVAGTKRNSVATMTNRGTINDVKDENMQSSPALNQDEMVEDSLNFSVTLVREEDLEELRSQYDVITSMHVYSLAPHPLKDLQVLSDATREAAEIDVSQDPLEILRTYGTVVNKAVKRQTGRRPLVASVTTLAPPKASSPLPNPADSKEVKYSITPNVKPETKHPQSSKDILSKGSQEKKRASNNPSQLKRDSSSIFKSFAKSKPKLNREGTNSSACASGLDSGPLSGPEDELMKDTSEGEEDYILPPQKLSTGSFDTNRRYQKEREAALKKMMEDEDDQNSESDVVLEDAPPESSKDTLASQLTEEAVQVIGGRRRGRRRVMKKKTIKDEEGYLVTREEPSWESFSEDEPVKPKSKAASSLPPSSDKSKKGSSKAAQGSIMSFFGKK